MKNNTFAFVKNAISDKLKGRKEVFTTLKDVKANKAELLNHIFN